MPCSWVHSLGCLAWVLVASPPKSGLLGRVLQPSLRSHIPPPGQMPPSPWGHQLHKRAGGSGLHHGNPPPCLPPGQGSAPQPHTCYNTSSFPSMEADQSPCCWRSLRLLLLCRSLDLWPHDQSWGLNRAWFWPLFKGRRVAPGQQPCSPCCGPDPEASLSLSVCWTCRDQVHVP